LIEERITVGGKEIILSRSQKSMVLLPHPLLLPKPHPSEVPGPVRRSEGRIGRFACGTAGLGGIGVPASFSGICLVKLGREVL
jgi:hypothetical protein